MIATDGRQTIANSPRTAASATGEGDEFAYARALEGAAQGGSVHETLAWLEDQGVALSEGSAAACEVAVELEAHGIEDEDIDPSWIRLRNYLNRTGGRR